MTIEKKMPTHWEADIFFSRDILFKRQCIFYELFSLLSSFLLVLPERFNRHILFFPGFVRAIILLPCFCPYSSFLLYYHFNSAFLHSFVYSFKRFPLFMDYSLLARHPVLVKRFTIVT